MEIKYNPNLNYCSFSPESMFGCRYNYACYLHDRQYRNEVKVRKTRKQADLQLKDTIYAIYKKQNKKVIGWVISRLYYIFTRLFGWGRYQ